MPQLLLAVSLRKTWLGTHFWKTPELMDLPVELEYIPYQELEARFAKLNEIARPTYPTPRANIVALFIFAGLFVAAAVGMARSGRSGLPSGFQIMGQSACFILPVLVILWIRLRKDSNAKARKQFKRKSQKLLRTWTAQDTVTHAIQWKLRQRLKSQVSLWTLEGISQQDQIETDQYHHHYQQQQYQQDNDRGSLDLREPDEDRSPPEPPEGAQGSVTTADATLAIPRRTADVYAALRNPTTNVISPAPTVVVMITPAQLQQDEQQHRPPQPPQQPSSAILSTFNLGSRIRSRTATVATDHVSTWEPWKELLRDSTCCGHIFREPKIWMIEISIRDGAVDEYALPVPSPVYCDYRLPGYEDAMGLTSPSAPARITSVTTGVTSLSRYAGQPPAYESDSDDDSVDEDAHMDNDEDHDEDSTHGDTSAEQRQSLQQQQQHRQQAMEMVSFGSGSMIVEMTNMTTVVASTTVAFSVIPANGKEEVEEKEKDSESDRSAGAASGSKRQGIEE